MLIIEIIKIYSEIFVNLFRNLLVNGPKIPFYWRLHKHIYKPSHSTVCECIPPGTSAEYGSTVGSLRVARLEHAAHRLVERSCTYVSAINASKCIQCVRCVQM